MLARISGTLERIDGTTALITLPGAAPGYETAYEVMLPAYLAERLSGSVGSLVSLHTVEYYEAHAQGASFTPRIMGFASADDRRFFALFTTVKGVGNKRALRALALPIDEVARAITLRDATTLQKLPEIGKRLAETMIVELSGKVAAFAASAVGGADSAVEGKPGALVRLGGESARRAAAALVRLGESEASADAMIRRAFEADPGLRSADELVAAALASR